MVFERMKKDKIEEILKGIKPEDIIIGTEKEKPLLEEIEKLHKNYPKKKLLYELKSIIGIISSYRRKESVTTAIRTDNYHLYSVADPHKKGFMQCLKDYILKNRLRLTQEHYVLDVKIPLTFEDYMQKKDKILSGTGKHEFEIKNQESGTKY